jgi:hypothetical protein
VIQHLLTHPYGANSTYRSCVDTEGGNPSINSDVDILRAVLGLEAQRARDLRAYAAISGGNGPKAMRCPNGLDVWSEARSGAGLSRRESLGDFHVDLPRLRLLRFG